MRLGNILIEDSEYFEQEVQWAIKNGYFAKLLEAVSSLSRYASSDTQRVILYRDRVPHGFIASCQRIQFTCLDVVQEPVGALSASWKQSMMIGVVWDAERKDWSKHT